MSQDNESELVQHPHRMRLWGWPGSLEFPPLCPNCGATALRRIDYSKVFRHADDSDGPNTYVVTEVSVPFCDTCIAQHHAEMPVPNQWATLLSGFGGSGDMIGAVVFGIAAAFTGYHALDELLHLRMLNAGLLTALTLFLGFIVRTMVKSEWSNTAYLRVPDQTSVTKAFDFSDSTGGAFEAVRFLCTMRDAGFATAFRDLNLQREYRPDSPRALADQKVAKRKFRFWAAVMAAIALYFMVKDWLH
jgi:hypothetical protein